MFKAYSTYTGDSSFSNKGGLPLDPFGVLQPAQGEEGWIPFRSLNLHRIYNTIVQDSEVRKASWVFDFDEQWSRDPNFCK